jgi:hypothetical protein
MKSHVVPEDRFKNKPYPSRVVVPRYIIPTSPLLRQIVKPAEKAFLAKKALTLAAMHKIGYIGK